MKCVSAPRPSVESRELEHLREELGPLGDEHCEPEEEDAERDEELRLQEHPPVRDREHEEPAAEAEQAAARQRREVDDHEEQQEQRQRHAQPVAALEAQVDRQQEQDARGDLDPEMVRVARERVHPVDERALDRAEDVDPARSAGDGLEPGLVEVRTRRLRDRELQRGRRRRSPRCRRRMPRASASRSGARAAR